MKHLFTLLFVLPLLAIGQTQDPCYSINDFIETTNSNNPSITLDLLSGWNMIGYACTTQADAQELFASISDKIIIAKNNAGSVYMPEFGFNGIGALLPNQGYLVKMSETVIGFELCTNPIPFHQVEGCTDCAATNFYLLANVDDGSCQYNICTDPVADNYQEVLPCIYYGCNDPLAANYDPYANTDDGSCVVAEACPYENYLEYSPDAISYNANLCVNIIVEGCTDNTALNYNSDANVDDNSCEFIYGCIDQEADNYNVEASTDDGSCIYYGCTDITAGNYDETANSNDGSCLVSGCIIELAENYNPEAKINDGSCIVYGCLLEDFPNYNEWANVDNGSCDMNSNDVYGCTEPNAYSYNPNANIDNGDCYMLHIGQHVYGGIVFYLDETGQRGLVSAIEDLPGYYEWGCYQEEVVGANEHSIGTGYQNTMDIVNQGCSTENGGITAAQAALNAEIIDYNDWYLPSFDELYEMYNTIGYGGPEGNIGGFVENGEYWSSSECGSTGAMRIYFGAGYYGCYGKNFSTFRVRPIRSFQHSLISGCTDPSACNYNSEANMADETCIYPEQGYDCDGNSPEIGGLFFGGILFYIDSTGQHGLVAAMEDLTDTYEWGCYGTDINGNNSSVSPELVGIGTGLQNTLEIVSGCSETPIAASEALAYVSEEGYSDWFLPSFDELVEMYNTIGNGGPEGNIGGFSNSLYWSSSEYDSSFAWFVHFDAGGAYFYDKIYTDRVRVIRAF